MHVGIDFGTTRTIVAFADRGNYPMVSFSDAYGDAHPFFPSIVANVDGKIVSGFEALDARADGAPSLRSIKRHLTAPDLNTETTVRIGPDEFRIIDVLQTFLTDLNTALHTDSSIADVLESDSIERVAVAVPAHARSGQRYITLESFRRAGFDVSAMLNEPSAAGFEYTHRLGDKSPKTRSRLVIYDLGGGTFDASLVSIRDRSHSVIDSTGANQLGGDDFDAVLAEMACREAGIDPDDLTPTEYLDLLDDAQTSKEQIIPQSRRIVLEVRDQSVTISVNDFYDQITPLIEQTVDVMSSLVEGLDTGDFATAQLVGLYLVGGASSLPIVSRLLRERFGRRVFRSSYPAASSAIGLAIAADPTSGYTLSDRLSRGFGVFREANSGQTVHFDSIFTRDQLLDDEVVVRRQYRAVHNVAWFRFVEYAKLMDGQPIGDIVPMPDIQFACVPELQGDDVDLSAIEVQRGGEGDLIEETYVIDKHGICSVTLTDLDTGWTIRRQLGLLSTS